MMVVIIRGGGEGGERQGLGRRSFAGGGERARRLPLKIMTDRRPQPILMDNYYFLLCIADNLDPSGEVRSRYELKKGEEW